jgi:hypothetical protein
MIEQIDYSKMSLNELVSLRDRIDMEIRWRVCGDPMRSVEIGPKSPETWVNNVELTEENL